MIKIDDIEFAKAVISLKRSFQTLDGPNAGRLMQGDAERDIIGTYYNYSAEINSSFMSLEEYDELYETISAPTNFHTLEVPYGQTTYIYQAYITNGSDELKVIKNNHNYWNNLTFNFIAKSPKRRSS